MRVFVLQSDSMTLSFVLVLGALMPVSAPRAQSPQPLGVTIIHTSDEHSAVLPSPLAAYAAGRLSETRGGFARLATLVADIRRRKAAEGEPVLLTSAGDHTGGSPFSWLMRDGEAPELTLMVEMGYDALTLGNHEFDHGPERLAQALAAAGYPAVASRTAIVATNTRIPADHPLASRGVARTHLDTLANGLRVGFIGLMGRGAARVAPAAEPVEFADARDAAAAAAAELRAAGAQLIVALTHAGMREDRALAGAVPDIDVILGGHDHRLVDHPVYEGETIIVHPGVSLQQIVVLQLNVHSGSGEVEVRGDRLDWPWVVPLDGSVVPEDSAVAERVVEMGARVESRIAELTGGRFSALEETIAQSPFVIGGAEDRESPLGNFVADAMRSAASRASSVPVQIAFQATGNLRGSVRPGSDGRILLHDLASVIGMGSARDGTPGYPLVAVWITGDEVYRVLELSVLLSDVLGGSYFLQVSGLRARYDPGRAAWFRIPFSGMPIPSGRAVLSVERDSSGRWVPIERGDRTLYHIVTDRYVASFLPTVGRLVPQIAIVPKNADGTPMTNIDDATVVQDGRALPVWQAVLDFTAAQPANGDGVPVIPARYAAAEGRLVQARGVPLWILPLLVLGALIGGIVYLVARLRRRRAGLR